MAFIDRATLGDADNQLVLNDSTLDPFFRTVARQAQFSDIRAFDTLIPEEGGIEDYKTLLGAVNFVITGKMYPDSQASYESGMRLLRSTSDLDLEQSDPASPDGYVPYIWQEVDQPKQINLKVLFPSFKESNVLTLPFTLFCKIKEPRIYGTILRQAGTGSSAGITSGGVGYPTGYPIAFGAIKYAISATAVNAGDRDAYPTSIVITGPVTNPVFTNTTTREFIGLNITMISTDVLTIVYTPDTVSITLNGNSVYGSLITGSTLFEIPPGASTFSLTGTTIASGASATIGFYDTWSLA